MRKAGVTTDCTPLHPKDYVILVICISWLMSVKEIFCLWNLLWRKYKTIHSVNLTDIIDFCYNCSRTKFVFLYSMNLFCNIFAQSLCRFRTFNWFKYLKAVPLFVTKDKCCPFKYTSDVLKSFYYFNNFEWRLLIIIEYWHTIIIPNVI